MSRKRISNDKFGTLGVRFQKLWNSWFFLSTAWIIPVVLAALQEVVRGQLGEGQPTGWQDALMRQLPFWAPLALLTPLLFTFVRRFSFDRRRRLVSALVHIVVVAFSGLLFLLLSALLSIPIEGRELSLSTLFQTVGAMLIRTFHFHLFMVGAVVAAGYALENNRRLQERELQTLRLNARLAEAQMASLSAQLRPHFLFNTLHSISSLMDDDKAAAQEMIAALSDLLRHSLQGVRGQWALLREDLVTVDLYLAIEKVRFQDRLREQREITVEALATRVPSLLLQPLVENAIRHGIARRQGSGLLVLRGAVVDQRLELEVADDGNGLREWELRGRPEGVGLGNTRQRLDQLYGPRAELRLLPQQPHGTRVLVSIPVEALPKAETPALVKDSDKQSIHVSEEAHR